MSFLLTLDNMWTPALTSVSVAKAKPTKLTTLIDIMKQAITKLSAQSAPAPQSKASAMACKIFTVISVGVSIGRAVMKSTRSTFETGSVYFAMMAMSAYLVDISFPVPLPAKPSNSISMSGTTRIWPPPLQQMCLC